MLCGTFMNCLNLTIQKKGMKKISQLQLILIGSVAFHVGSSAQQNPNILIIYADDLGYGDVKCFNRENGKIPTPNIDRLASQGMMFTDAHSSSSVSSPSRYALLTGRYHWRSRLQKGIVDQWEPPLITQERLTVAGLVKTRNYSTYAVGKWHLGWNWPFNKDQRSHFTGFSGFEGKSSTIAMKRDASEENIRVWNEVFSKPITGGPTETGFDYYFGTDVPNWPPFCFIENDHTLGIPSVLLPPENVTINMASFQGPALKNWDLEKILPAVSDKVISIIAKHGSSGDPFLIYFPLPSPHTPLALNREWVGKSGLQNKYADWVVQTDYEIGRILDALDKNKLYENTIVFFTSDNGCGNYIGVKDLEKRGHFVSGPLRGYKGEWWDGGHRIPFIIRYPGVTRPGSKCEQLVHQADIMATIADILDIDIPESQGVDSYSLLSLLKGSGKSVRKYAISTSATGVQTIRNGPWKLICTGAPQLYNLADDIGEIKNIASLHPRIVRRMLSIRETIIANGRSTKGNPQKNDVEVIR